MFQIRKYCQVNISFPACFCLKMLKIILKITSIRITKSRRDSNLKTYSKKLLRSANIIFRRGWILSCSPQAFKKIQYMYNVYTKRTKSSDSKLGFKACVRILKPSSVYIYVVVALHIWKLSPGFIWLTLRASRKMRFYCWLLYATWYRKQRNTI